MSAIKKQTKERWSYTNELTPGGHIVATVWRTKVGPFNLKVTNWTGFTTLNWRITHDNKPGWWAGAEMDRYEYTVSTLKDFTIRKAWDFKLRFDNAHA